MKSLLQILAFFFSATLFYSNAAHALNFESALQAANENSHELKELRLELESSTWAEKRAMAAYMPRLDLVGRHILAERFEVLELEFNGANVAIPAIQPYSSFGVSASIDLFSGFQTTNQLAAARLMTSANEQNLRRIEDKTRATIRTYFYRALGSQILVTVADQNIQTLEGHLKEVNSRVRSGVSTKYDTLRTEVQLEDARTEKVLAENNVAVARAKLFEEIALPDDGAPLVGMLPTDFNVYDVSKVSLASATRKDREAQSLGVEAQSKLAKAAKAHWLPWVSVFGNQEWYNNSNHSMFESDARFKNAYTVGLELKWNLFDGGGYVAAQQQAEIARKIAVERLARLDQSVPVELEESKRRFSYNVINYKAKLSSIRKAEEAVRLATGGVRAGIRTNTEVLDAVVDLNRAKAASVKSQVEAIEALGLLELAVGHSLL